VRIVTRTPIDLFLEKQDWQLRCQNASEYERFDQEVTDYVVTPDAEQAVLGTAHLLTATYPYLPGDKFPHFLDGMPVLHSPDVLELSSFAEMDFSAHRSSTPSPVAASLLQAPLEYAARHGAR
jgi:acyl homoserine lactone synthase